MPVAYSAMPANDDTTTFSQAVSHEKNERIARASLSDIMLFQKSVDEEIKRLTDAQTAGAVIDKELFTKMLGVKSEYQKMMDGFIDLDDDRQRHALIVYADAVQDLITHLHRQG